MILTAMALLVITAVLVVSGLLPLDLGRDPYVWTGWLLLVASAAIGFGRRRETGRSIASRLQLVALVLGGAILVLSVGAFIYFEREMSKIIFWS